VPGTKPEIETARLHLRQLVPGDLEELYLIRSDAEVMRFITGSPSTRYGVRARIEKHLRTWDDHGFGHWAVTLKEDPGIIGWCGLDLLDQTTEIEVGYGFARAYWGLGFATESAAASLCFGFTQLALDRIAGVAYPENVGSWRVMAKLGMKYVRTGFYYGKDMVYYEISSSAFRPATGEYSLQDNPKATR